MPPETPADLTAAPARRVVHATRASRFTALGQRDWDVLVVGGGITGCGIARDAALRGLSVALVEKDDFASGTSSRSSRLVHGGVRYLEHGQIHLVFEASAERRRLLTLAPHLVHPLAFTWPVYSGARIPRWKLLAGLWLYDALALFRNVHRHERLSAREVLAHEPGLARQGLRGGALYYDAATNDARLTLANAVGAVEAGGVVLNHARLSSLRHEGGRVVGGDVHDGLSPATVAVNAKVVVNATGPWSDDVRALDGEKAPAVRGSKGVHIAVPRDRVGNNAALTLLSPRDGRVLFVLPAGERAIIGTTDTYTSSSPDDVRPTRDDIRYLLDSANGFFPDAHLGEGDVVSAWAGIRPLVPVAGQSPGAVSREHAVSVSARGLVSITGGKLTTFRVMAEDVLAQVFDRLGRRAEPSRTRELPLPGGDFSDRAALMREAARTTSDVALAEHLTSTYGTRWTDVWAEIERPGGGERLRADAAYTIGELRHAVRAEMACTLGDLLIRRTHVAYETRDHGANVAARAARAVASELGWDEAEQARAVREYQGETRRIFGVDG